MKITSFQISYKRIQTVMSGTHVQKLEKAQINPQHNNKCNGANGNPLITFTKFCHRIFVSVQTGLSEIKKSPAAR